MYRDAERVQAHKEQLAAELAAAECAGLFSPKRYLTRKARLLLREGSVGDRLFGSAAARAAHLEQLRLAEEARQLELCSPGREAREKPRGPRHSVEDLHKLAQVYRERKEKLRLNAESEARENAVPRVNACVGGPFLRAVATCAPPWA